MELVLNLELPTSLNKLYTNQANFNPKTKRYVPTGKRILSKEGRACKMRLQKYAKLQLREQKANWDYEYTKENFIYMDTVIYFNKRGRDDNNIYKLLCDALEKIVYDNDSRVLIRTQRILYDKENPRVVVRLKPVKYRGIFRDQEQVDEFEKNCKTCSRYRKGSCSILKQAKQGFIQAELDEKTLTCHSYKCKK